MTNVATTVTVGDRPYMTNGNQKQTITDITLTTNSEVVTADQLGLAAIFEAHADIEAGVTSNDAIYATPTITSNSYITLETFTADGTAATVDTDTVVRVFASGY